MKLWAGRFQKEISKTTNDFNSSISFDSKMYKQDIRGSIAHATMLGKCGIIDEGEAEKICDGLEEILNDIESGKLQIDMEAEDIHTFIEGELTRRLGDTGKRLHTARSRNDQVALDIKMYLRDECDEVETLLKDLLEVLCNKAEQYADTVMPGYTHLQRAQPITFGHHLMAYAQMLLRDLSRLHDAKKRMNIMPLGSCALAGTTYPIDRSITAQLLGFDGATENSLDGVSDRDFCIELASVLSIIMVHLSRFSEEIIAWCSWEFKFVELDDAFSTGSSIMPQKKNPDIAELVRGKSGRVFGDLTTLLTIMKGIALAYNKDMQEDKEAIFDAFDTVKMCLTAFTPMIDTMTVLTDNMRKAAAGGFINATDCADYLVKKGLPFRDAYKATGTLVAKCIELKTDLEQLPLDEYKAICDVFDEGVYEAISLEKCVNDRKAFGGPAKENVLAAVKNVRSKLN
ncbi:MULTISPECIES: argininosuccinate lyase [unclassified Ruminococcus]|uniref:argininosuccinate lyase n=1 Tax=unclassified Ruminococcus TaxID=2608920 RepID=UPI00210F0948|nr:MULTISPECIES: argininosuccinate lyase [unclassified Ruminococcus]MCQ4023004.1 argininosuccinate lyase [Ruminococcus sp. zg-924]MCQ4115441.1 argininosuccinate lyase [Ruminococcus sp. zg-921]